MFILARKDVDLTGRFFPSIEAKDSELEIVDSIPLEEVTSIRLEPESLVQALAGDARKIKIGAQVDSSTSILSAQRARKSSRKASLFSPASLLDAGPAETKTREDKVDIAALTAKIRFFAQESDPYHRDRILVVSTENEGFNRGQTYYFVVRNQQYPFLKSKVGVIKKDMFDSADLTALSESMIYQASKHRTDFERKNMFTRIQKLLQMVWDSIPFNLAVLALIVSNFVFTVQQMENDDPARQPYFDRIDLAYTVLFTIGVYLVLPFRTRCCSSAYPILRRARAGVQLSGACVLAFLSR
jgi:hypothetical protein